ncbi:MAG: glutamate formimidoyltransferase [Oscillospiraceae bacterium]|nr:glutamate formimidoyltransferase [Oscillospiraceae bacterium]
MPPLIECVPNISEGRDRRVIDDIVGAAQRAEGCRVLHVSPDEDHNRTVITMVGSPASVGEAAVALAARAASRIDLTRHSGEHPRMGAVDVVPFVPLREASYAECAALSRRVGARIWREARVPVFLYALSATGDHRKNLADIRRGGFEGMFDKIKQPQWRPDFGGAIHPTAGAVACGARRPLVAFNVNLDTDDISAAREIAKALRQSDGGLPGVLALGMLMRSRNRPMAQVSMNLCDTEKTPLWRAFEAVRGEALARGICVAGSEIVGMISRRALDSCAGHDLRLTGFDARAQVLEDHIIDLS